MYHRMVWCLKRVVFRRAARRGFGTQGWVWRCACDCSESRVEFLSSEDVCLSLVGVDEMIILRGPYLGFGGGGLGTPVVSYAPRPILQELTSMEIIMVDVCGCGSWRSHGQRWVPQSIYTSVVKGITNAAKSKACHKYNAKK